MKARWLVTRARESLWLAPGIATVAAISLAIGGVSLDHQLEQDRDGWYLFDGGPLAARELLSTVTSAMLSFTVLVFSITVLVLQLASSQFSPRVVRTFLDAPITKWALATFVGTFVFSICVLSQVRGDPSPFVPAVATWTALLLVLISVGVFVRYIHAMAHSIRAINVIAKISAEVREGIDEMYPEELAESAKDEAPAMDRAPEHVIEHRGAPGVLAFTDPELIVQTATRCGAVIEIVPRVGDFLPAGAPLFRVWGKIDEETTRGAVRIEVERTPVQDPAFGVRQLVDIAVRALSPGTNDPTTAVQALDHLHDLVRRLTIRGFPARARVDSEGHLRVIASRMGYAEYVDLAFSEILHYGKTSPRIVQRISAALLDCAEIASGERRVVLREQLAAVRSGGAAPS